MLRLANGAIKPVRTSYTKWLGLFRQPRTGLTLPVDGWSISPINNLLTSHVDWHVLNNYHVSLWFVTYMCLKCWISLTLVIAWLCHVSLANVVCWRGLLMCLFSRFRISALRDSWCWESLTSPSPGIQNPGMICLLLEFRHFSFRHFGTPDVKGSLSLHLSLTEIPIFNILGDAPFRVFAFRHFGTPDVGVLDISNSRYLKSQ